MQVKNGKGQVCGGYLMKALLGHAIEGQDERKRGRGWSKGVQLQ